MQAVGQGGALVHHGAAMKDQLLHRAGGAVLGRPGFEFGVMGQEQVGQIVGVLGVVLGAAGDEGLAILLEGDGVDGIERDPVVGFQEGDEVDGGLFQAQADAGLGMLLAQLPAAIPRALRGRCRWFGTGAGRCAVSMRHRSAFLSERSRPMTRS